MRGDEKTMEELIIRGGSPLRGTVQASGAKNAALPVMAASLLTEGVTVLHRVPRLRDVATMVALMRGLGAEVEWVGPASLRLRGDTVECTAPSPGLVCRMRASVCVLGPLLARHGRATLARPGGCTLGPRPIDLHLKGLRALGARIEERPDYLTAGAEELRAADIHLAGPRGSTVLGTANVLMAATAARGRTVIRCAAREPEIQDLARFLVACGAQIRGIGTPTLTITGSSRLRGVEHQLIPDRIEAATFLAAGVATRGGVRVEGARPEYLRATLRSLRAAGARVGITPEGVEARCDGPLRAVDLTTGPYPGLPTDVQPQLSTLLCLARGSGLVHERVYPERFAHVEPLRAMGARIVRDGPRARIRGKGALRGTPVRAPDIRAGAALVVAGLAAHGVTTISGVDQIDRGYQDLETRLRALGADIRRRARRGRAARKSA